MELGQTLYEIISFSFLMFWQSWWALVLGFTIAGAVEAFVSEEKMSRVLGGSGIKEVGLGTLFGAASSSCSFGAVATTKSLFKKGASPEASFAAFQFASTNLVIELGLVMWILLGWQFVAANFLAGLILILLLTLILRFVVPRQWFEEAREHVKSQEGYRDPQCGMEVDPEEEGTKKLEVEGATYYFCSNSCKEAFRSSLGEEMTWRDRLLTRRGWSHAFQNALGEWKMLYKDIAAGFIIAAVIAVLVPRQWWATLFGLGAEGSFSWVLSSAFIGVVVGVITFVCSVGNVPFAVVLWQNGIAFGGVMSFIFADLIVPNITDAYRRYYGWRMALTLFGSIFITAVISGVIIHYVWHAVDLVPPPGQTGGTAPHGYTLYLNIAFSLLFLLQLLVAYSKKEKSDGQEDSQGGHSHGS